jgi:pimeloyl-ACP methyl ester carboxylesterase
MEVTMNNLLSLSDGRQLQWADNDIQSDQAIVLHHGTTISLDVWRTWFKAAAKQNVRVIAINRPGVDQSTRKPGRTVFSDIEDVSQLLDNLGVTRFVAVGWSGGGARALGSGLIKSCVAIHTIAGIARFEEGAPDSSRGLSEETIERAKSFQGDFDKVFEFRSQTYEEDLALTYEKVLEMLSSLPQFKDFESDYTEFSRDFKDSIHNAMKNCGEADADDFYANVNPWGFDIDDIKQPVTMWHGLQDDGVVIGRSEYLEARLINAKLHPLANQDHISIAVEYRDKILSAAIQDLEC